MKPIYDRLRLHIYHRLIEPHSTDVDGQRRELILNILLVGLFVIASLSLAFSLIIFLFSSFQPTGSGLVQTFAFWLVIGILLTASRRGRPRLAALLFVGFLLASSIQFALDWSFRLAQAELVFVLTIIVTGVLFQGYLALLISGVVVLSLLMITYLQVNHLQVPDISWGYKPLYFADTFGYAATFAIIGVVSWLANRETDRSLQRARTSERALLKERDSLERKVIDRTHELEEMQVARLLEMQPFAEFGRIGASLVHEIANPLTAANLHLAELSKQQHSDLVQQVQRNLQLLERYLTAARKQIKRESDLRTFSVGIELKQIARLLSHRARRAGVRLVVAKVSRVSLYGDVVKFDQLVANLLANAIDASEKIADIRRREVTVDVRRDGKSVVISIHDHGQGIPPQHLDHIFEPFYSTKASARQGLGIGLAMVKQYVEHDFRGSILLRSGHQGTLFTIILRDQERL